MNKNLETLIELLHENTECTEQNISEGTRLVSDLQLNSYELVNLVVAIEDTFNVEIDDTAITEIQTVNDVLSLIEPEHTTC